jgi:hypothetical protein
VSNSERRNEAITPWTRVVATLLLFAAFSAVVIYVLDFVSGHARPWPLSGYKTAFLAVFSVAFFPAVFMSQSLDANLAIGSLLSDTLLHAIGTDRAIIRGINSPSGDVGSAWSDL